VFCLIGDGGFNMNIQELRTMARMNIPVRTFILNNGIYGNTVSYQDANYGGRRIAGAPPDYSPPDFVKIAKAYGVKAYTIDKKWEAGNHSYQAHTVDEWLPRLMGTPGPWICDVVNEGFCNYEPRMVSWSNPVEDMQPYLSRDEFKRNMVGVEPWDGWENNK
jgi:acetolactate synthase-1/2/3 large subunit